MFDIKNLSLKDWIIGGLVLLIIALGYKYFTANSEIKKLSTEIETLKKKLEAGSTAKLINLESVISSSDSDSDSDPEPTNYQSNKTIETFNNNKSCDGDICWISGRNAKNQVQTHQQVQNQQVQNQQVQNQQVQNQQVQNQQVQNQQVQQVQNQQVQQVQNQQIQNQIYKQVQEQRQVQELVQAQEPRPLPINVQQMLPPIQQEDLDMMKDITSFLTMADCVEAEVDAIVGNNIYIPVDLKQLVNQIYESPETAEEECKFNPVILDSNDVINVKPDQIESNIELEPKSNIPDFINIPLTLGLDMQPNQCIPETNVISEAHIVSEVSEKHLDQNDSVEQSDTEKVKSMKINDLKNLAKKLNIKLTEHSRPKNRDQLIAEINKCQSVNSQKNI